MCVYIVASLPELELLCFNCAIKDEPDQNVLRQGVTARHTGSAQSHFEALRRWRGETVMFVINN